MKQLLAVTAMLFCAWLTLGFTTTTAPQAPQTITGKKATIAAPSANFAKRYNAWTNPFFKTNSIASARVSYEFDPSETTATYYLRIRVNGVIVVNSTTDTFGELNPTAGSVVTFEASITPWWIMSILIDNQTTYEELYYLNGGTGDISFSWTVEADQHYHIWYHGH